MEKHEAQSVGEILRQALEESMGASRLDEFNAVNAWPRIIGPKIASQTSRPYINKGIMTIRVESAPLRHELNMMRSEIANAINREIGKDIVKDLKFRN